MNRNKIFKGFNRRIKRFLKKPKIRKISQKILESQKYAMVCYIASINNPPPVNPKNPQKAILWLINMGWDYFKKLMNWVLKYVVYFAKEIGGNFLKIIMTVSMPTNFIC